METRDPVPVVAWVVLGILAGASALAMAASSVSGALALAVILSGVAIALLPAWAARSGSGSSQTPGATGP
ncbi:MAG TPA: hypothetical protein VOB72_20015 [Candidatus Dormibacteraeota bacterium]|nr:hypothetical protein [Candidatus Dormibacteraeota bacterium]